MTAMPDPTVPSGPSVVPGAPGPVLRPVDPFVPDEGLSLDDLGSRIVGLAGRIAAATGRWLRLVAEFDAREGYARFGLASTARWLSHACGISHRTAVEHVRVARALVAFPALAEGLGRGELSYSHVRAISRVARAGEARLVDDLVELARNASVGQVETMVRGLRTVEDNEQPHDEAPTEEYFSRSWTTSSQWRCHARLAPEDGAVVDAAIEALGRAEGVSAPQALLRMAELALVVLADAGRMPRPLRGEERAAVVIHLDAAAVEPETTAIGVTRSDATSTDATEAAVEEPPTEEQALGEAATGRAAGRPRSRERGRGRPWGRIAEGPGLPRHVVMRLLCGGRIRPVVHDAEGNVRDLGRSRRVVNERLFRALLVRDCGCAHPGCESRSGLEAHHVRPWLYGGRTDLANLVLLCGSHHKGLHLGEFSIVPLGRQVFRYFRHDGAELERHVDPARLTATEQPVETEHCDLADDAATTRWTGEYLDRDWAIAVLAQRRVGARASATARRSAA